MLGAVSWSQHYPLRMSPQALLLSRELCHSATAGQQDDSQEAGQQDVSALFVTGLVPITCYLQEQITVHQDFLLRHRLPILFVSSLSLHCHLLTLSKINSSQVCAATASTFRKINLKCYQCVLFPPCSPRYPFDSILQRTACF